MTKSQLPPQQTHPCSRQELSVVLCVSGRGFSDELEGPCFKYLKTKHKITIKKEGLEVFQPIFLVLLFSEYLINSVFRL